MEQLKSKNQTADSASNIIGQFGVGFYSAFMVAERVEVYSRAATEESGYKWSSDGYEKLTLSFLFQAAVSIFVMICVWFIDLECMKFNRQKAFN